MIKTKSLLLTAALAALLSLGSAIAQSASVPVIPVLAQPGQPFSVNGQTFVFTTNDSGGIIITTTGPAGSNTVVAPVNSSELLARVREIVNENNPANIGYYGSNDLVFSVAGVFAQNSGQAAAQLSIEKFGLLKSIPQIGVGAAVLEGNQNGVNGTAAAYAFADYRKPIGDVAFSFGLGAGYDNYTSRPMGIARVEVEYRQNAHLGEFVGVGYDFEGMQSKVKAADNRAVDPSGLIIGGGIRYSF
jgi:hypothetical protein